MSIFTLLFFLDALKINKRIRDFFIELRKDVIATVIVMFRIMIPVSIVVKILKEAGAIGLIGQGLAPLMKLVGLPGEMGLVWGTGMITNLFGGIMAYLQVSQSVPLSIAQITVLSAMMLVAHTFPIELQIARKSGVRLYVMFVIRFCFAFLLGAILNLIFSHVQYAQQAAVVTWRPEVVADPSLQAWALGELKSYGIILLFIISLIFLIKLLREIGIIKLITRALGPLLRLMGIGEEVTTITIIGLTLGIVYGGALIINETRTRPMNRRDIFYSLALMGLCHSVIEDTILVVSLGADIWGVLVIRLAFALLVTWMIVKISQRISDSTFNRYVLVKFKKQDEKKQHSEISQ
jgi:spore maturation protein SpmB